MSEARDVGWRTANALALIGLLVFAAFVLGVLFFPPTRLLSSWSLSAPPQGVTAGLLIRIGLYLATLGFTGWVAWRMGLGPRRARATAGEEGPRLRSHGDRPACPMCRDQLGPADLAEGVVRCPTCQVAHHGECWKEHGGCATFACGRSPREREKAREQVGGT